MACLRFERGGWQIDERQAETRGGFAKRRFRPLFFRRIKRGRLALDLTDGFFDQRNNRVGGDARLAADAYGKPGRVMA